MVLGSIPTGAAARGGLQGEEHLPKNSRNETAESTANGIDTSGANRDLRIRRARAEKGRLGSLEARESCGEEM